MNQGHYATPGALTGSAPQWAPSINTANEVDRVLALDEIAGQIGMANERLSALLRDARQYADSLLGSQPSQAGAAGPSTPKPTGRLHGLRESVEETHSLIAALHDELSRLRGI